MSGIPIKGTALGTAIKAYAVAVRRGAKRLDFLTDYLTELYRFAPKKNINADVLVAQFSQETGDGTSVFYTRDGNVAGFGVPSKGPAQGLRFTPVEAARAQVIHMCCYAGIECTAAEKEMDPRWQDAIDAGFWGTVRTTDDLGNGRWAEDTHYSEGLVKRYEAYWGPYFTTPEGEHDVTQYSTVIPGLPGGPLLTDYPIKIKLIPEGNTYQRPGIKANLPRRGVQHGTGNPNSLAAGEITWLVDQQAGGGQVSFHSCADDAGVWVAVPADEVTWQAADGPGEGNMNGFSCEMIENEAMWANLNRRQRAIYITADFMGRVAARLGIAVPEQHWTFNFADPNRHDCPNKLRHVPGAWGASYVPQWKTSKADELRRMAGQPAEPTEPAFDWSKAAKPIPVPVLLATDIQKNDTAEGVTFSEGGDFVFVADVVEAIAALPRLQKAYEGAPETGPDIDPGERFVVAWLFKAKDGNYYYLTPAPYWTRILAIKVDPKTGKHTNLTKRISDAPLIPGSERAS